MSIMNGQHAWPPPQHHQVIGKRPFHSPTDALTQSNDIMDNSAASVPEASDIDEDRVRAHFRELYHQNEARIAQMFAPDGSINRAAIESWRRPVTPSTAPPPTTDHTTVQERPAKRVKRTIDEDDYGDDDEDDDEDDEDINNNTNISSLKSKVASATAAAKGLPSPSKSGSSPITSVPSPYKLDDRTKDDSQPGSHGSQAQASNSEDARKQLEEARKDTEEAAKRSFYTTFYTLENDRAAMLEQQQLEESEKQLQAEMDKNTSGNTSAGTSGENHGSLSSANLGASSLTLKHLIARIDMKRDMVRASDAELRLLMNEVRKNRSKWASEENVNQEELYEALEKVLTELKAHTEYSTPFLQRVNKKDAPDYYNCKFRATTEARLR